MHAVHSLFCEPLDMGRHPSPASFFRSFALSFELARQQLGVVRLVTDALGAEMLTGWMGLPYDHVDTSLDELHGRYPKDLWEVGKIRAYELQTEPFLHLDADFFLLKALPAWITERPMTMQSLEGATPDAPGCYGLGAYKVAGYVFPESWQWCLNSTGRYQYAANMGLYAVNDLQLNQAYCREAMAFLDNPTNQALFAAASASDLWPLGVCLEQFTPVALCRRRGVEVSYLTKSYGLPDWSGDFVHLYWKYKTYPEHDAMVTQLLSELAPQYLQRALDAEAAVLANV